MLRLSIFLFFISYLTVANSQDIDKDKVGLYDPATGTFFLEKQDGDFLELEFKPQGWKSSWLPVVGDWNGDGWVTVGLFDPEKSHFHLENLDGANFSFRFGPVNSGWLPLAGDWNGNGIDSVGFYDAAGGRFLLKNALSGGVADHAFSYGGRNNGRVPLTGDWNGSGFDTIAVYDPTRGVFFLKNVLGGGNADIQFATGTNGLPIAGDWNGDGRKTVGLYGGFLLTNWLDNDIPADTEFRRGPVNTDWQPVAGNWDERTRGIDNNPAPPPPGPEPEPVPSQCGATPGNVQIAPNSSSLGALPAGLTVDWNSTRKLMFDLGAQQIHAHAVTTSSSTSAVGQVVSAKTSSASGIKTIAISPCPGDFNVPQVCKMEFFEAGSINWKQGSAAIWQCELQPNRAYYINVRNGSLQFPGTGGCPSGSCRHVIQILR